jgi:two-component system sensor histidine kinase DesK
MDDHCMNGDEVRERLPLSNWRRWIHYDEQIWLVYIGFWFLGPYYDRYSSTGWLWLAAAILLFVSLYVLALRGPVRYRKAAAVGIFILGLVYVPFNQSACGIFIFLAAILPELFESTNLVLSLLISQCVLFALEALYLHLVPWSWSLGSGISMVVGMNAIRRHQQQKANAKLRLAHNEIERLAKTAERERIARDMHDVLGHSLSLIVLKSELAGHLLATQPAKAAREVAEIESTARQALAEVRKTITGYRSEGFNAELVKASQMLEAAGVHVQAPERPPLLTARHEATLSMVLREAVTNIVRHARASECSIELSTAATSTHLVIADNGCGDIRAEGNGLRGMRERVQELGGKLVLESSRGTRLQIELPQTDRQMVEG